MKSEESAMLQEQRADCFGIRVPLTLGQIQLSEIPGLQRELAAFGKLDWEHFSGPKRAVFLERCVGEGMESSKWERCKEQFYTNIDYYTQATPLVASAVSTCKQAGPSSAKCIESKGLVSKFDTSIQKGVAWADDNCPFVMEPKFIKAVSRYQDQITRLKHVGD